jgi:FlaA1/EpsC-like NDP-sugar epimerase
VGVFDFMRKLRKTDLIFLLDIVFINISILLSYYLRFDFNFNIREDFARFIPMLLAITTIVKIVTFLFFKMYKSIWRYAGVYDITNNLMAIALSNIIIMGIIFLTPLQAPKSIFIIAGLIDAVFINGIRFGMRIIRRLIIGEARNVNGKKRVLIIGGGEAGAIIIKELREKKELNSIPVAVIDDDYAKRGKVLDGVSISGSRSDINEIVKLKKINEIIIAIPSAGRNELQDIYNTCIETKCRVKTLPSVSQLINEQYIATKVRDVNIEDLLIREPVKLNKEGISSYIRGKRVLITGAGGTIGSELSRQIAEYMPEKLILLDNYENNLFNIANEIQNLNLDDMNTIIASIRDKKRLDEIFTEFKPDVVFHAAAHKHVHLMELNKTEAIKNNVFGTLNLIDLSDIHNVEKFVLISSDKAVNPTNIMGASKRIAEMIIQAKNKHSLTNFVAVRFGNVLGSNGSVVPLFKKQIENGGPVTVTHPDITRYFMTVEEAVSLVLEAGYMAEGGEVYVLDMGEPVKIYDLAKNLIKLSGLELGKDIEIDFIGLKKGEKLYEELLLDEEGISSTHVNKIFIAKPVFTDYDYLDNELNKMNEEIDNSAYNLDKTIKELVPTYKSADKKGRVKVAK